MNSKCSVGAQVFMCQLPGGRGRRPRARGGASRRAPVSLHTVVYSAVTPRSGQLRLPVRSPSNSRVESTLGGRPLGDRPLACRCRWPPSRRSRRRPPARPPARPSRLASLLTAPSEWSPVSKQSSVNKAVLKYESNFAGTPTGAYSTFSFLNS